MLIPNTDYIIIETTKEEFAKRTDRTNPNFSADMLYNVSGCIYAVGDSKFSDSPVMGDGRSFSWARRPDEFPLKNGEEVVCSSWEHATVHEGKHLFLVRKESVLAVYRSREQVEATLFDGVEAQEEVQLNA